MEILFLAITTSNLHQIQKVRSVLKSACSEDFKTEAETIEVKDTKGHFQFSDFQVIWSHFSVISASTWPNIKSKDSFEILRTSRFHNLPYFLNVVKIWRRYCLKMNSQFFLWTWFITMTRNWLFRGTKP